MNQKTMLLGIMIFLVLGLQPQVVTASATTSKEEATAALAEAESMFASAYNATVNAEQVGANISSLLVSLNDAAGELSRAEIAYRQGDFNLTVNSANICSQVAQTVKVDADKLRLQAYGPWYMSIWSRVLVSIFAVAIVGLGSFWAWRFFKRRYYRRLLTMKPEEVSHDS